MIIDQPPVLRSTTEKTATSELRLTDIWKGWFGQLTSKLNTLLGVSGGAVLSVPYGSFICGTTQTAGAINTPQRVPFTATEYANGMHYVAGDGIHAEVAGMYQITISAQFTNSDAQAHDFDVYFRKNGTNLANSAVVGSAVGTHGGQPGYANCVGSVMTYLNVGDYIEVWWSTNNVAVTMNNLPAITVPFSSPAAPALSAVVAFVSA